MKRFINITISVITLLALIIILVIGLDIQSLKLGSFTNAQNINSILINLSYSYIAGAFFYFLVTTIPFYLRKRKINLVIKDRINIISKGTQTIIFAYDPSSINLILDRNNENDLLNLFKRSTIFDISNVAKQVLPETNTKILFTINQSLQIIDKAIDETLNYLDYLSEEQIILLNNIKNSAFKNTVSSSTDNEFYKYMFNQPQVVDTLAIDFIVFWKDVKKLNSISK